MVEKKVSKCNCDDNERVCFRDLSGWLKVAVICAWVMGGIMALAMFIGFIEALFGVV